MLKGKKDILWTILGQFSRVIFQSGFILLLAVLLNPEAYGKYTIVVAIITIMGPFIGLGFNQLLIELNVKKELNPVIIYTTGFWLIIFSFLIALLSGIVVINSFYELDSEILMLFIFLAISDLLALKITELNSQMCIANSFFDRAAKIQSLISISRFLAVAITFFITYVFEDIFIFSWLILYAFFSIINSLISMKMSQQTHKNLKLSNVFLDLNIIKRGFYYSIGLSSQGIYNDVDKIILSKTNGVEVSQIGHYGLTYKLMDVVFVPLKAILIKNFPLMIAKGKEKNWLFLVRYLKKMALISYAYITICIITLILFGQEVINFTFGSEYDNVYNYLLLILPLLFFRISNYLIADVITGLGYQKVRSVIQICIATANFILSIILIKVWEIEGAVVASYLSEFMMIVALFVTIIGIRRGKIK